MPEPIHVLVVDGGDADRYPVVPLLSEAGANITVAHVADMSAAHIYLESHGADAIITELPGHGADNLVRTLRGIAAGIPVLMWANAEAGETADAALRAGAQDVLNLKELKAPDLARAIRYAIARGQAETEIPFGRILEDSLTEVYIFDAGDLHFVHVNRGARDNLGYSMYELLTMTPLDVQPDFNEATLRNVLAPLRSGRDEKVSFRTANRRKDGGSYPVEVHLVRSEFGSADVFVAVILDITRRKTAEVIARRQETRLQTIMDTVVEAVITIDRHGAIESFNKGAERMFGYTAGDVVGTNVSVLMPETLRSQHDGFVRRAAQNRPSGSIGKERELVAQRRDGMQFPIELALAKAEIDGEVIFTGIVRDISERKGAERAMAEKTLQLEVFARRLKQLHALHTSRYSTPSLKVESYIREGCDVFGMEYGIVGHIDGDRYTVEAAFVPSDAVAPRGTFDLGKTCCSQVVRSGRTLVFPGTESIPGPCTHAPLAGVVVGSYIGTPIHVNNKIYGTLSYASLEARKIGFTLLDVEFIELMAESLGRQYELREAEEARARTQNELDNFFTVSLDLLCISSSDGYLTRVSPAWEKLLGYTPDELMAKPFIEFIHPEDREATRRNIRRQKVGAGSPHYYVNRYRAKNGQYRWLSWISRPASDNLLYSVARDVTTEKKNEERLRLHSRVLENMAEGVTLANENGEILYTNSAQDAMFGCNRGGLIGSHIAKLNGRTPEEHERFFGEVSAHLRSNEEWSGVTNNHRIGGADFITYARFSRLDVGGHSHWVGVQQDITEQTKLNELLSETQSMASVGGWELDLQTNELTWTDEVYRIHESPVGTPLAVDNVIQKYHPESRPALRNAVLKATETGEPFDITLRIKTETGRTRWVRTHGKVHQKNGRPFKISGMCQDITEIKNAELIKNEFVSMVSHELRSPLTSINGSLGLIAGGVAGELPPKAGEMVEIAYRNSERLVRLINDILDVQRIESGKMNVEMRSLDISVAIEQALAANKSYGDRYGITFQLQESIDGLYVFADSDRLQQVMSNILSNAAKFSPPGGTVGVDVNRHGDNVRVSVSDLGPGISARFQPFVFDKFAQDEESVVRAREGTGLGMSISKSIIELHNGTIGFESEPGNGTTFYFDLPIRSDDEWGFSDENERDAGPAGHQRDEDTVRQYRSKGVAFQST